MRTALLVNAVQFDPLLNIVVVAQPHHQVEMQAAIRVWHSTTA